jgi:hypothetical protein
MTSALGELSRAVDLAGVFASAVLGGAVARGLRMNPIGFGALALVAGLGGGLIRDTLLQHGPPAALTDPFTCSPLWRARQWRLWCRFTLAYGHCPTRSSMRWRWAPGLPSALRRHSRGELALRRHRQVNQRVRHPDKVDVGVRHSRHQHPSGTVNDGHGVGLGDRRSVDSGDGASADKDMPGAEAVRDTIEDLHVLDQQGLTFRVCTVDTDLLPPPGSVDSRPSN